MNAPESIEHLDIEQVFLIYGTFAGDINRTAAALNLSPTAILRLAEEEHWLTRLEPIIALSKSQRPGDWERAANRAINWAQMHRLRLLLERTIRKLTSLSEGEFTALLEEPRISKDGEVVSVKLSTRALADLASALEKCHAMGYMALNDSAPERAKRKETHDEGDSALDIHAKLAEAMNKAGMSRSPRVLLFEAQVAQGEALAVEAVRDAKAKENPLNDDEH